MLSTAIICFLFPILAVLEEVHKRESLLKSSRRGGKGGKLEQGARAVGRRDDVSYTTMRVMTRLEDI